jgi:hypothetical protein
MAKEEFDAWHEYFEGRREDLPKPDFDIEQHNLSLIKENFDRFKVSLHTIIILKTYDYYRIEKL